jgi:hypothetical protein
MTVRSNRVDYEVERVTAQTLYDVCTNHSIAIDVDNLTEDELTVMLIGLHGAENIVLTGANEDIDIFSLILTKHEPFKLLTRKTQDRIGRVRLNVMGPEVALCNINTLCTKLGVMLDWLNAPGMIRGLAMYNKLIQPLDPDSDGGATYIIDCPPDAHYGSILGPVCNHSLHDTVDHTNLGACSGNLLLEIVLGQTFVNNIHYLCESLGLLNSNIFGGVLNGEYKYVSLMNEMGMFKEEMRNKLVTAIFSQGERSGLYGDVRKMRILLERYVQAFHEELSMVDDILWLQINTISGPTMANNTSNSLGKRMPVTPGNIGSMVRDLDFTDRLCEWLVMYQIATIRTIAGGLSSVGEKALYLMDPSIYEGSKNMCGIYKCQWVEMRIESGYRPRPGYDTLTMRNLYYSIEFYSVGRGRNKVNLADNRGFHRKIFESGKSAIESAKKSDKIDAIKRQRYQDIVDASVTEIRKGRRDATYEDKTTEISVSKTGVDDRMPRSILEAAKMAKLVSRGEVKTQGKRLYSDDALAMLEDDEESTEPESPIKPPSLKPTINITPTGTIEVPNAGAGNCLAHAITDFCEIEGTLQQAKDISAGMGWIPDSSHQSVETGMAFNHMMGYNTVIYNEDDGNIHRSMVDINAPTCRIRYSGQHYTLLDSRSSRGNRMPIPKIKTNFDIGAALTDVQENVAQAYSSFLEGQGIANNLQLANDVGMRNIQLHDVSKGDEVHISIIPERDKNKKLKRGDDPFTISTDEPNSHSVEGGEESADC